MTVNITNTTSFLASHMDESGQLVAFSVAFLVVIGAITKIFLDINKNIRKKEASIRTVDGEELLSYIKRELILVSTKNLNTAKVLIWASLFLIFIIIIQVFANDWTINSKILPLFGSILLLLAALITNTWSMDTNKIIFYSKIRRYEQIFSNVKDEEFVSGLSALETIWMQLTVSQKKIISESIAKKVLEKEENAATEASE